MHLSQLTAQRRLFPLLFALAVGAALPGHSRADPSPPEGADACQVLRDQYVQFGQACRAGEGTACAREAQLIFLIAQCEATPEVCSANAHGYLLGEVECRRELGNQCARASLANLRSACEFQDEARLRSDVGLVDGKPLPSAPVMMPEASSQPVALYPLPAFQKGIEGEVVVQVDVSAAGRTLNVGILKPSRNRDLDFAAMDWLRAMPFKPAQLGDVPVIGRVRVPVRFSMGGRTYTPDMPPGIPAVAQEAR